MAGGWRWVFVNQQQYENFSHAFLLDKFRKYLQIDFESIGEKRSLWTNAKHLWAQPDQTSKVATLNQLPWTSSVDSEKI